MLAFRRTLRYPVLMQLKCVCKSAVPSRGESPGETVICPACHREVTVPGPRGVRKRKQREPPEVKPDEPRMPWVVEWVLRLFGK